MMRIIYTCLIILFLLPELYAQGFLKRDGDKIVDGSGEEVILRAMGLGGWMLQEGYMLQTSSFANAQYEIKAKIEELIGIENTQAFYEAWLANHCRKIDIDSLAAWGFNSVRLPMHYNLFTLPIEEEPVSGEHTWLTKGFELTDALLDWCQSNEMYLILDLHAAPGGQGYESGISDYDPSKPSLWESAENRAKTIALWRKLAERYADEPWIGGYDLINETNWDLPSNNLLKQLYRDITTAIREVDTNHIIYIEGNWFANDFTGLTPPWDDNMVYSFHKYWSYNNQASIQWMLNMRTTYNIPIWCGEAGENSNVWFRDAIQLLENNHIGWAWWPLKKVESINSPLSVIKPAGYQTLLDYWAGQGSKPSVTMATNTLMQLAENLKLENCPYNSDVIDAMFRQIGTTSTKPYKNHRLPGIVATSDYDLGPLGFAYHDTDVANYHVSTGTYTAWNNGWTARNDGVDLEPSRDAQGSPFSVGWINAGEWLGYTIQVAEADDYDLILRVASPNSDGQLQVTVGDQVVTGVVDVPATGGWYNWQNLELNELNLPSGQQFLKLSFLNGGFNINQMQFLADTNAIDNTDPNSGPHFLLMQNYPNPFNNQTTIPFRLDQPERVIITIFDINGAMVTTLTDNEFNTGTHEIIWDGRLGPNGMAASGIYYYRLQSRDMNAIKAMLLIR